MSNNQTLIEEEVRAKEYVDFYYFWLFQYYIRRIEMLIRKEQDRLYNEAKKLTESISPTLRDYVEASFTNPYCVSLTSIDPYESSLGDFETLTLAQKLLLVCKQKPTQCLCRLCKITDCIVRDRVIKIRDDSYNVASLIIQLPLCHTKLSFHERSVVRDDSLIRIALDTGLSAWLEKNGCIERGSKNYGVSILGVQSMHIGGQGDMTGNVIAELDLSTPLPFLLHEITAIKKVRFSSIPTYDNLIRATQYEKANYQLEKSLIEQTDGVSFSTKDKKARAVGLWLYDQIDVEKQYKSVIAAHRALQDNTWLPPVPSWQGKYTNVLSSLGYAASETSVLRRLYRNTKRCIDACEVLSLKD